MNNPIQDAKDRRAVSPRDARQQSAEYFGFAASVDIQVGDEVFEVPNPGLLDDDQQERYNELQAEMERTCDREDDVVIPDRNPRDVADAMVELAALELQSQSAEGKTVDFTELRQTIKSIGDGLIIPGRTIKGMLKQPNQIDGVPIKPAYNTRLAIVLFGEDGYAKFKAGGGRSNQVALIWLQMQREFEEKTNSDSKSGDGPSDGASVPTGDQV